MKQKLKVAFLALVAMVGMTAVVVPARVFAADDVCTGINTLDPGKTGGTCTAGGGITGTRVMTLAKDIVNILLFITAALAVIMLIVGGLRYVLSGGNQQAITAAKTTIMYSVIGLVVAILAFAIVNFVISVLGNKAAPAASLFITLLV